MIPLIIVVVGQYFLRIHRDVQPGCRKKMINPSMFVKMSKHKQP